MSDELSKVILLIDMDGVLCHWYESLYHLYRRKYPLRSAVHPSNVTEFHAEDLYPEVHRVDLTALSREKGFYRGLRPIKGSLEALKDIQKNCSDFIEPFICSSPEVEYDEFACHTEKAQWVNGYLGEWWLKKLILTKDKTLVRGHIIIDDKPEITGAMTPTWMHVVYEQPYNKHVAGITKPSFNWAYWPMFRDQLKVLAQDMQRKKDELRVVVDGSIRC